MGKQRIEKGNNNSNLAHAHHTYPDPVGYSLKSDFLVPFDGHYNLDEVATEPPQGAPTKEKCKEKLAAVISEMSELQRKLFAYNEFSLLLVFQAMDAAGKDSTIRAVMSGIDPAGCQVYSFKKPTEVELDHDFLWRTSNCLPERGRIGIFNRSYYEEVLVVRVHPEYLLGQRLPHDTSEQDLWAQRYESIRNHERHLAYNGTVIIKFFLNVSPEEQAERFIARIDEHEKNWKFNADDVKEHFHWNAYKNAYEDALAATSRPWAPWYTIPADKKAFMQLSVAEIVRDTLKKMPLEYPESSGEVLGELANLRRVLKKELR